MLFKKRKNEKNQPVMEGKEEKKQEKAETLLSASGMKYSTIESKKTKKLRVRIEGISQAMKELDIPENLEGYPVRFLAKGAFKKNLDLEVATLPEGIKKLRKETFAGCRNLKTIKLPAKLETIEEGCFKGCSALEEIEIPATVETIESAAFENCKALKKVKLGCGLKNLGENVFDAGTEIWCDETVSMLLKDEQGLNLKVFVLGDSANPSHLMPASDVENASRYALEEGCYVLKNKNEETAEHQAKIFIAGNLHRNKENTYTNQWHEDIKDLLKDADLTIGGFGVCESEDEMMLAQIRDCGFDMVVQADGQMKDAHAETILSTLDACNRAQLMHTGLFTGRNDKRYISLKLNGIHIAVIAYTDSLTTTKPAMPGVFAAGNEEELRQEIHRARQDGAGFVLVYHYCREQEVERCAHMIAEAGADYLIGCYTKEVQPYSVILTTDGRKVPVIYGVGDFPTEEGLGLIVELNLKKDSQDKVQLISEGWHPCIMQEKLQKMDDRLKNCNAEERIRLEEGLLRLKVDLGVNERFQCYVTPDKALKRMLDGQRSELQKTYEVQPILTAKKHQTAYRAVEAGYRQDNQKGCYVRQNDEGMLEARIVCTGQIEYGRRLEKDAECFGSYEFMKSFKSVAKCFEGADFVVGNLSAMASEEYPSTGEVAVETRRTGYNNCRIEYIEALQKAGMTGLAAANTYNACLGIDGIFGTEKVIKDNHLIPMGIGNEKNPIVEINGIKIGFVSITTDCINGKNILTGEAVSRFINLFDAYRTEKEIREIREKGAEFVLTYVHCGANKRALHLDERMSVAEEIADMGADYIICTVPKEISKYYKYETKDGRIVPIATSLGSLISGKKYEDGFDGAILKVIVRKTFDGKIEVDDNYIPIRVFDNLDGAQQPIMPAHPHFNKNYEKRIYGATEDAIAQSLGEEIKKNCQRVIKLNEDYTKNFTIAQLYDFLGQTPSERDLERLGDKYNQQIRFFTLKEETIREGCVAILYDYINFGKTGRFKWDLQKCIDAGVTLVIDNEPHDELPCIVTEEPLIEVYHKLASEVRGWYDPIRVAITGSMGKTTTKEMTVEVFDNHFKTLTNGGNANVIYQIGLMVQKLAEDDGAYVQEVHGGTIGMASAISKLLAPDICILTNIEKNHMSQVGSVENLIASKMGIIDGLKEDGVLIACKDNEFLKDIKPPVRMIQYSVSDPSCHYYAQNIKTDGENLFFEIVSNESEFDHAGVYPAKICMQGEHNVGNAIAAFAAGRQAGIPPHEIIAGLSRYRTKGIRQNIFEHNGIKMILDTHNSNPKALLAMFDVFDQFQPADDGRKVLVLGMMGEQGDDSLQIHYDTGKAICEHDFDLLFCFGEDAKQMVKAAKECGREAYYFDDRDVFNRMIAENVRPGDVVMVKGSHAMELDKETMVPIFGKEIRQK